MNYKRILSRTSSHRQTFEKLDKLQSRRVKRIWSLEKEIDGISLNVISRIVKKKIVRVMHVDQSSNHLQINHRSLKLSLLVSWVVCMSVLFTVMLSCESYWKKTFWQGKLYLPVFYTYWNIFFQHCFPRTHR